MDALTYPMNPNMPPMESLPLPTLVLNLDPLATSNLSKPSDYYDLALCPSIQSNLPKPQASLLIRNPSLPSLGMRTAITWQREQLLTTQQRLDERNCTRRAAGMIPVTQTMSQILDTVLSAMAPWSIAMDMTPPIHSRYQHRSHPYLSDHLTSQPIEKWPEFTSHMQMSPCWQLKLPDSSMKTMKIPLKYWHPLSSQQMKGLPKGWAYVEDDEEGKHEELRDPNRYGHLPPRLTHTQQQHEWWHQLNCPKAFVHNVGEDFIPFTITNEHGVPTPARFIQVHMTTNPYVIGRLTLTGTDYCTELHATPNDDEPIQHITDRALWMFDCNYPAANVVNTAVVRIDDQTLEAEVMRHRSTMARLDVNQQQQKRLALEREWLELTLGMCRQRLEDARACNHVLEDMVADQHIQ